MHGQGREAYKTRQREQAAKLQAKADQWYKLRATLKAQCSLELNDKLLQVNPDPLHLWNQRREHGELDLEKELQVTAQALQNNPKAYGAWFHRKWCMTTLLTPDASSQVLPQELALTEKFLQRDERNFHCWNYRRFVVGLMLGGRANGAWSQGPPMGAQHAHGSTTLPVPNDPDAVLQAEWDFTTRKIHDNFSNFSAFHYRSKLLRAETNELDIVENAIFTEPDDQTAWWYHRFLLENTKDSFDWSSHLESLRELSEEVPDCKWVWLGILGVEQRLDKPVDHSIIEKLIAVDPDRKARYEYLLANK